MERPGDTGNFDEEQYNQYLLGTDGPRKRVEYSKVTLGDDQEDDLSSFEVSQEPRRVQMTEEEELARALEQIRAMETEMILSQPINESETSLQQMLT